MNEITKKIKVLLIFIFLFEIAIFSQSTVPIEIVNNSTDYADDEIYVCLIGRTNSLGNVWLDFSSNTANDPHLQVQSSSTNTIHKVANDWGYTPMSFRLSDIKNKTFYIPYISSCRMYISFKSPLYMHIHDGGGVAEPSMAAGASDPSAGIRREVIELSWASNGLWMNTTRVDCYQYPMGVELWGAQGANNAYLKAGELLSHSNIIQMWQTNFPSGEFSPCLKTNYVTYDQAGGIIEQISKLPEFLSGGIYQNYFQPYIDQIWSHFVNNDFIANCGNAGTYTGRINNSGELVVSKNDGTIAKIYGKPTTQDVVEAKGRIAEGNDADRAFQAQFCGALCRGMIDVNATNAKVQNWGDINSFFTKNTYNKYVWFFHQSAISYDRKCYAFAYDDTWDQSSTIVTSIPSKAKITVGGFYERSTVGKLASITVTPSTKTISKGVTQAFVATGKDANNNTVSISPTWTTTGGTINNYGQFSSEATGTFTITATVDNIKGTASVTVNNNESNESSCIRTTQSGDFTVAVSADKSNPTFTFIPGVNGKGSPLCLFFYTTDNVPNWEQIGANAVTPNVPFRITAGENQTVHYYYVYSLSGGGEQNSMASNDTYKVGSCMVSETPNLLATNSISAFPNPFRNNLTINFESGLYNQLSIVNISGITVLKSNISGSQNNIQLNTDKFNSGIYFIKLAGNEVSDVLQVIKH